jgi:stearoyl-CoA desaturase (delta-9 desaturase)
LSESTELGHSPNAVQPDETAIDLPVDPPAPSGVALPPASLALRVTNLVVVVLPFMAVVAAIAFFWGWGFGWVEISLLVGMYVASAIGITVGYHRFFTHRSFETSRVVQCILGILGSMAVQGPLLKWVAMHRCHHMHSDRPEDPHSPHQHGGGLWGMIRGLFHAHLGWLFRADPPNLSRYVKDLRQSRLLRVVSALFPVWVIVGLLIPTALGLLLTWSWWGALFGLIWGGLVRIFFVHHVTWSVNSLCHWWGRQPYHVHDHSRNNWLVGILAMGEGWHNNHHAFPRSARHGLRWWQIDMSYWIIRAMAMVGLVWKVKVPGKPARVHST